MSKNQSSSIVAAPAAEATLAPEQSALRAWIIEHDDSWLFIVLYVGLAVVLSIWISLFWLVAVVAVHLGFELVRQSQRHASPGDVLLEAFWELKLDFALVLFALVLALYMEVVLGVVGLQAAARLGAASKVASRFAGWQRAIRGVLLSVDDAAQVVRAAAMRRDGRAEVETGLEADAVAVPRWGSWSGRYTVGAWIAVGMGVACIVLILAAPWLTAHSVGSTLATLARELRPLP